MNTEIVVAEPIKELQKENQEIVQRAKALAVAITDQQTCDEAGAYYKAIGDQIKRVESAFADSKKKAKAAHQAICELEKSLITPLKMAEIELKRPITEWMVEEQKRVEEENRKREEEARKAEEEARLAEAKTLEDSGQHSEAQEVISAPITASVPKIQAQKTAGLSSLVDKWSAEVTDLRLLCKAIGEGKQPITFVTANMTALDSAARGSKGFLNIPGVRAVCTKIPRR